MSLVFLCQKYNQFYIFTKQDQIMLYVQLVSLVGIKVKVLEVCQLINI